MPRVILQPSPEKYARWEKLARFWGNRTVAQMVTFVMDMAARYLRELDRERKAAFSNAALGRFGFRMNERDRLQKAVKDARDALDKLIEVLD